MHHARPNRTASAASDDPPVSVRIVETIADREGTDPASLDPVLYDVLDPDALDSLFDGVGTSGRIEFTYLGYDVAVDADGTVTVGE